MLVSLPVSTSTTLRQGASLLRTKTTTTNSSASTFQQQRSGEPSGSQPLPLEWTRVKRRRSSTKSKRNSDLNEETLDDDDDDDFDCCRTDVGGCLNSSCRRKRWNRRSTNDAQDDESIIRITTDVPMRRCLRGTAFFCLPDADCDWFQGYLFVSSSSSSLTDNPKRTLGTNTNPIATPSRIMVPTHHLQLGLLCRAQEIDACLECDAGGYRELSVQVREFLPRQQPNKKSSRSSVHQFSNVEWTGGDMMRLASNDPCTIATNNGSGDTLWLQADSIRSGSDAVPYVEAIFASLLQSLRQQQQQPGDDEGFNTINPVDGKEMPSVLELMPNVAVVSGTMEVWLPQRSKVL